MRRSVYIETTIPSFYHEVRTEPDMIARRDWTRFWWDGGADAYDLFTSEPVLEELGDGDYPNKAEVLDLVADLPLIPVSEDIAEIVAVYIAHRLMPEDPVGDALHLALASFAKCDFRPGSRTRGSGSHMGRGAVCSPGTLAWGGFPEALHRQECLCYKPLSPSVTRN